MESMLPASLGRSSDWKKEYSLNDSEVILLMLAQSQKVIGFIFDVDDDVMTCYEVVDGKPVIKHFENFTDWWFSLMDEATRTKMMVPFKERKLPTEGTFEYVSSLRGDGLMRYRVTYRRCGGEGRLRVAGFMECLDAPVSGTLSADSLLTLPGSRVLTERFIDNLIRALRPREKGVFVVLEVSPVREPGGTMTEEEQKAFRKVAEILRADFRAGDIFGRTGEAQYVAFFRGAMTIDIIERRLRHILELFVHVQHGSERFLCNLGVVTTSQASPERFAVLLEKGEKAVVAARKRGPNRYRMYNDVF